MRARFAAILMVMSSLMVAGAGAPAGAAPSGACPRVEMTSPGSPDPLVPAGGVTHAAVGVAEGQTVLNVRLTPAAAARLRSYTAAPDDKQIVMLVDGKAFKSVKVRDPITGQGVMIGPVDRRAGEVLASRINGCAKP